MLFYRLQRSASVILSLAVFILVLCSGKANAGCTCPDCNEMVNRYKQVNCLLEEICKERTDLRSSGKASQKFDFGDYNKNYLANWKDAMGKCRSPKAKLYASGNTDGFCNPTYKGTGDNNCMYGSVKAHEEVHVQTCKNTFKNKSECTHSNWPGILQTGYADCITWEEYFTDDINAYNTELGYLKGEIDFWAPICKELGQWCLTAELEPSKCSSMGIKDLFLKIVRYFTGIGKA
jgi:hypothetical protein